jgi:hypothetical protein
LLTSLSVWPPSRACRPFSEFQRQSAINHITQKVIEIATDVKEYAQRPDLMRPESETSNDDLVIDFGELQHCEAAADGYGDYVDPCATCSLNG